MQAQTATEALEAFVKSLDPKGKAELDALLGPELSKPWLPEPTNKPQLEAYFSDADLLLYGGAAGGGKTDLLCGYALCEARRTVIFRRQATDLEDFWDRLTTLSPENRKQDSVKKRLVTMDGRLVELAHLEAPGSEKSWQGRAHDFIGFEEGAQLTAQKVSFVMGWLRSAEEDGGRKQRCRVIIASNPPIGGEGLWLIEWFAPWLDPLFSKPAAPGELRWAIKVGTDEEIKTVWVDGPGQYTDEGQPWRSEELDGKPRDAMSRTFIPARLEDNRYLGEDYRKVLNDMPEPLRSQLLHGDFLAGRKDDEMQVVPSEWVRAAQARWEANKDRPREPMLHMGVDVAQGGADTSTVAGLRGVRFEPIDERPGKETPTPVEIVEQVFRLRRDDAGITVDHGGGYGGGVSSHLKTHNNIITYPFVPGAGSGSRTRDGSLKFKNLRAEAWWKFREALDPGNPDHELIELPPDSKLLAQLTAPTWKPVRDEILIESKDDIRKRLGTSTDRADAVIMCWFHRKKSLLRKVVQSHTVRRSAPMRNPIGHR